MRIGLWGVATIVLAATIAGCGPDTECGEFPLDDDDRECVVRTIDEMVHESFPFAAEKGIDLNEFSERLWATLEEDDRDDREFLSDVNNIVSTLNDGHTRMEQRFLEAPAVAPVDIRRIGDDVVIDRTDNPDYADLVGQRVEAVDGEDALDVLEQFHGRTAGIEGSEVTLSGSTLALAGDSDRSVELTLEDEKVVELQRRSLFEKPVARHYGAIGYLRVETFGFIDDLERLDEALNEVKDTEGLIIDLRGNGGGFPSVCEGLFARLIDEPKEKFTMVDVNDNLHRHLHMEPRGDAYDGPVAVLTDRATYSASNLFSHRFVYHDRGVLVGEATGGGAASPANGAMLLPGIWFQVSTHVVRAPDGQHREEGIPPHIRVDVDEEFSTDALRVNGGNSTGDPVKDRAIHYLEGLQ